MSSHITPEARIAALEAENRRLAERLMLLQIFARSLPDGSVTIYDHDLRYRLLEGADLRSAGMSSAVEGKTVYETLPPDVVAAIEPAYRAALRGETNTYDMPVGDEFFRLQVTPAYDEAGEIMGGMVLSKNITAERQAEDRYRSIIESLPIGIHIYRLDAHDRLVFSGWNAAANRILKIENQQFMGQTIEEAFPSLADTEIPDRYRDAARSGIPWQTAQITYDDQVISGAYEVYAFRSEPRTAVIVFLDVTERKRAEAEREAYQAEVIELQRRTLRALSTPIIPIMEGIIIMPLVGAIDTMRASDITRTLLAGISRYRAQVVIIDITGVEVIDTGVAGHLNHTIQAARLKGTRTIITGISDSVAETIVDLGIDWTGIDTLRDLQSGLITALREQGVRLQTR